MPSKTFAAAPLLAPAALALSMITSAARAEDVRGTRSDKLVEKEHTIRIVIDRDHAVLTAKRTVYNGGPRFDQAMFHLDVPPEAVATGLRSLGAKDGKPIWFEGELMEAEAAAAKYRELTGIGGYYPKDPALLSWRNQSLLFLQVFPCAPAQPKTVEITYVMPVRYAGGRYHVKLPAMGTTALRPVATVATPRAGDQIFVDGAPLRKSSSVKLDKEIDLALAASGMEPLSGVLASVAVSRAHNLARFHIDAAPKLSSAPKRAHVVVVLDTSRSRSDDDIIASIGAARATLAHLPDAKVELLTFDRRVAHRYGTFVKAASALDDWATYQPKRGNGSALDEALAEADRMLAKLPATTPKRILLLSDLLTRSKVTPASLKGALVSGAGGALLHIGVVREDEPRLTRNDDHEYAPLALATKGVLWEGGASRAPVDASAMRRVFEEWARPVRVHHVAVRADGLPDGALDVKETLDEGEGFEDLQLPKKLVSKVELTGQLWGENVQRTLLPSEEEGDLWSALVFGSPVLHQLSEQEMMVLAVRGHAVSPVTSLLAIEPGVRPSTEGLGVGEGGGGRGEGIGLGSIGTLGRGAGVTFDKGLFLKRELARVAQTCNVVKRKVKVVIESTRDEIADVTSVSVAGAPSFEGCVREGMWGVELSPHFVADLDTWEIEI